MQNSSAAAILNVKLDQNGEGTYQTEKLKLLKDMVKDGDNCGAVTAVDAVPKPTTPTRL